MNKKELKGLAKKIANLELKRNKTTDKEELSKINSEIMNLCGKVKSFDDVTILDDLILEILENNSWLLKNFLI